MDPELVQVVQKLVSAPAIASAAAAILSLACNYLPILREWFAAQGSAYKQMAMLIIITGICGVIGVLSWVGNVPILPAFQSGGWVVLLLAWFGALQANSAVYDKSPQLDVVKRIKEERTIVKP